MQTARELNVDQSLVEAVYKSYWGFIKNRLSTLSFRDVSEEELSKMDANFNIPFIGKLYVDYDKVRKYNNQLKYYQHVKAKRNQANRQSGISE